LLRGSTFSSSMATFMQNRHGGAQALLVAALFISSRSLPLAATEVVVDNTTLRASLDTYIPGETSGPADPRTPRFIYVLAGGRMRVTDAAGASREMTLAVDSCLYGSSPLANARNIGNETVVLLDVEMKRGSVSAGTIEACLSPPPSPEEAAPAPNASNSDPHRRVILLSTPDLLVTRVELASGAKAHGDKGRGMRLIYVLRGGSIESRHSNGERAMATQGGLLWVGRGAPVAAQENGSVLLLEVEPQDRGNPTAAAKPATAVSGASRVEGEHRSPAGGPR
jgi:hypothetical protein